MSFIYCRSSINHDSWNGLHTTKLSFAGGFKSNLAMVRLGSKSLRNVKKQFRTRAAVISGEGDLLSYSSDNGILGKNDMQADAVEMGALSADVAPTSAGFAMEDDECDLDRPTPGFASIPEAIEDVRRGKVCIYGFVNLKRVLGKEVPLAEHTDD